MALLHAVSNGDSRHYIDHSSPLGNLINNAIPLGPVERAELIYHSQDLENAHQTSAQAGQSKAPDASDDIDLHYVCFIKDDRNHLWELDGRRKGPLDRGVLDANDDVLSQRALELGPRRFMKREEEMGGGELRFSLVTLAPSLD